MSVSRASAVGAGADQPAVFGYTVLPPTTVRAILMFLISSALTSCGSFSSSTKSASLPAVIEPLTCSSCEAYAPLIVATVSASSIVIRCVGPQTLPSYYLRVTMLWIAISGSNGPGP